MKKFSSILLLLLLSLIGVTVQAQISDVSEITNGTTYTIKSVNRGFIFYDAATSTEYLRASSINNTTVNATPTGELNEQFAFLRGDNTPAGQYYLYHVGTGKFVTAESSTMGLKLSDTPKNCKVTFTANGSYFILRVNGLIVNITAYTSKFGFRCVPSADPDDGNKMTIKAVGTADLSAAVAQINASETPDIYQVRAKDNARGVLYAGNAAGDGANEDGEMSTAGSTYNMDGYSDFRSVTIDQNNAYQQFAFIEWQGKTYLYNIGTQSYVYNASGYFAFSQTNKEAVELQAVTSSGNTAYKLLKFLTTNTFLTFSNGGGRHAVNPQTNRVPTTTDGGDLIAINAIGQSLTPAQWAKAVSILVLPNAKNLVENAGDGTLMGLPSAEGKAALSAKIAELEAALEAGTATYAQVVALQEAVDNCPVNMPKSGKAYTIQFKHMNGAYTYFYWDATSEQLALGVRGEGEELPETAKFICRQVGDQYAFVNNAGKYLTWRNNKTGDGYNNGKGVTDAYNADQNLFTLATIAPSSNVAADAAFLSGTLSITGTRANGSVGVFVIKAAGEFDGAGVPYVTNADPYYSSAAIFTETTYPNTATFKATDLTDGENAVALATFSAPFATVLPEGVTAYSVTQDPENSTILNVTALTGQALPANTGFILAGTAGETVTLVPATDETLVNATGTLLQHSAGAPKALNQDGGFDFILGAKNDHVAFYRVNDAANELPMNRAYLHLTENPFSLGTLHMNFGGSTTTAIQGTENAQQFNAPIYDLSGRRVQQLQKGGIYVQSGKKFIVK